MALTFVDGSSEYLSHSNAILTVEPFTFAAWCAPDSTNKNMSIMSFGKSASNTGMWDFRFRTSDKLQASKANNSGTFGNATITGPPTANVWQHCCAVFESDTSRSCYLDGGNKATNSTNISDPSTINQASIGASWGSTARLYFDGEIAEACIYNVALSDAEVALLAQGISPLHVRPNDLVGYWPLIGRHSPEIDIVGGFDMTVNGTPTAASHINIVTRPPLYMPGAPATGGGGGTGARSFGLVM